MNIQKKSVLRICAAITAMVAVPAVWGQENPAETADQTQTQAAPAAASETTTADTAATSNQANTTNAPIDKRIFGVLPNYRTANGSDPFVPISAKRKLWIGFKDSFDYPVYFISGAFAGLNHLADTSPEFGQGLKGYAKRYAASYADQAIGNMMTESFFPILFKQDPRYFRLGAGGGSVGHRTMYALSRVLICHDDKGALVFNSTEWLGNAVAVGISNAYYKDNRNLPDNVQKLGIQVATDAFSNVLKEFWPDIKKKMFKKKGSSTSD